MRRPSLLIFVATIFSVLEHVHGAPVVNPVRQTSVVRRGDPQLKLDQPTQYHTVHTTQTALGPVTETCDIQLTPFKAEDGCDLVREDRKCVVEFVPNGVANSNNGNSSGNGNNGNNSTDTSGSSTDGSNVAPNSGQNGATIVSSGSTDVSATSSIDASATNSASSSISTSGSDGSSTTTAASTNPSQSSGAVANDNTPTSTSPPSGSSSTSTSSAAPDTSPTQFKLPGTQLSVLPIGLGVFAGVSVIALIVVGLVTYERTKYRKAFRERKLAEQGQAPGMSERPTLS